MKSARLLRQPCDTASERRALVALRCLDRWAPETLGGPSVALARALAAVPWIREPDRWAGGDRPEASLIDHLVRSVKYPLPSFLYGLCPGTSVWRPSEEARLAIGVLAFVAGGRPLNQAPMLPRLTARQAHLVWTTERAESVLAAVRRAQVLTAGGPEWLATALCRTALGRRVSDEAYWGRVIAWLAAHVPPSSTPDDPMGADRIGPIVDYLRSCRTLPTSVSRLIREERRWHVTAASAGWGKNGALPPSGFPDRKLEVGPAIWSFCEILSNHALQAEGAAMEHCVATYYTQIASRQSSIWSMRRDGDRVLTIQVWNAARAVVQIRGQKNRRATAEEQQIVERWASDLGLAVRDRPAV